MVRERARRPYREGSVYKRAHDGRWVGTIEAGYTKTGARRRLIVTAKTEAEVKRKLRDRKRQFNADGATVTSRTTVKAWSDTWLEITERKVRPKTHTTDRGAVSKWIVPTIGHKRLDQLTPADVRAVTTAVTSEGHSTTTAHRYHGVLIRMLKAAVEEGHDVPTRALAVKPPTKAVSDRQAMTVPEATAILTANPDDPAATSRWAFALLQGMRQGECLGATWPEVDLTAGLFTVSWQLQALPYVDPRDRSKGFRVPDGYEARHLRDSLHLVRPKSRAGWRVIPLVPWMATTLSTWRDVATPSPHGLVWPGVGGRPANARADEAAWAEMQQRLGVQHPSGRPYHLHEARNTTATLLMEMKVPESVRIAIMGHSSIAVTRGYEYVDTAPMRLALEAVAQRLGLSG